jgi:hypothetical protein
MYVIDYPKQRIRKFSNVELEDFLNTIIKKDGCLLKIKRKLKKY